VLIGRRLLIAGGSAVERFGRYQLLQPIARGGMAEILLARPLSGARRYCAVKRILPAYSQDLKFVSMFIDEARITIGLEHPHIVRLEDFGQVDGTYFMAMEYVDGRDLAALLHLFGQRGQGLPPVVALAILRDVVDGLVHAHELCDAPGRPLHIVHRDVSPHNILLSSSGEVKLTDFGIAAARNKLSLTTPGMVLGKAAYMAPEQVRGGVLDFRVDLWAVGVVLWECLAGERLFAGPSAVDVLDAVLDAPIPPPSRVRPGIPASLDALTATLLVREPRERPASSRAVLAAFDAILDDLGRSPRGTAREHFDRAELAQFLRDLEWTDTTAPTRPLVHRPPSPSIDATQKRAASFFDDPPLRALIGRLRDEQEPWILVDAGDRALALGQRELALSAWRSAAAGYASRGLLVQALAAYAPARQVVSSEQANLDVMALGELEPGNDDALVDLLRRFDSHGVGLAVISTSLPVVAEVPLLSRLGPRELAAVADVITVRAVKAGDVIIREGERGECLYAVAKGRLVVSCSPGDLREFTADLDLDVGRDGAASPDWSLEATSRDNGGLDLDELILKHQRSRRIFLGGLADGDFFGEFSFLADKPRSATVEAVSDAILLEIDRTDVDAIAAVDPAFTAPLLEFYKERVVELVMAKSPIFSLLSPDDRRRLLAGARLVEFRDGELIVQEGMHESSLWFIRRGEVEVFRSDRRGPIFINKLGVGQFFGETAALRGSPRSVSVRAIGATSLLCIAGPLLQAAVAADPRLQQLMDTVIVRRSAELKRRVLEHRRVVLGT
jgi:serine/threonine protein kinase/CRP-like cAMP-binding protein